MRLDQVLKENPGYRLAARHDTGHFYPNSFEVEIVEKRLVVVAVVKRHINKRFRIVGVLKRKT